MFKPEDKNIIARFRTMDEAIALNDKVGGILSADEKDHVKLSALMNQHLKDCQDGRSKKIDLMKKLYVITDLYNESMSKYSVCSKGCSHCCKVPVDVTHAEAEYIEANTPYIANYRNKTKIKRNKPHQNVYNPKSDDIIEFLTEDTPQWDKTGYCPFHEPETATCKIREFRPMACRSFFAFDSPVLCKNPHNGHWISTSKQGHAEPHINTMYAHTIAFNHKNSNTIKFKDIRQLFDGSKRRV